MQRKLKFKPLNDFILVNPIPMETTTKAGLILPYGGKIQRGSVEAVARFNKNRFHQAQYKSIILFLKGTGVPYTENGHEYIIMKEKDIICVL